MGMQSAIRAMEV